MSSIEELLKEKAELEERIENIHHEMHILMRMGSYHRSRITHLETSVDFLKAALESEERRCGRLHGPLGEALDRLRGD